MKLESIKWTRSSLSCSEARNVLSQLHWCGMTTPPSALSIFLSLSLSLSLSLGRAHAHTHTCTYTHTHSHTDVHTDARLSTTEDLASFITCHSLMICNHVSSVQLALLNFDQWDFSSFYLGSADSNSSYCVEGWRGKQSHPWSNIWTMKGTCIAYSEAIKLVRFRS